MSEKKGVCSRILVRNVSGRQWLCESSRILFATNELSKGLGIDERLSERRKRCVLRHMAETGPTLVSGWRPRIREPWAQRKPLI